MERCEICRELVKEENRVQEESGWLFDTDKKIWICRDCRYKYCSPIGTKEEISEVLQPLIKDPPY